MKTKLLIWWIDDERDRLTPAAQRAIEKPTHPSLNHRRAHLELKHVGTDVETKAIVSEMVEAAKVKQLPDIVVIDQILNVKSSDGAVERGSSLAVRLRVQGPSVPFVGVTGVPFERIASLQKNQFIELFSRDAVHKGDCIPDLFAIADGFATAIKASFKLTGKATHRKKLIDLLDAPEEDAELLYPCIPGAFQCRWDDETPHAFARWIWHFLMGRPGFLYDDLEAATLVGLNENGLERIAAQLRGCEYDGVFASVSRRRWWVSKVRSKVRDLTGADASEPLWLLGRRIAKNQRKLFSRCYGGTSTDAPNVVAFADDSLRKRVQTRIQDSAPLDADTPPLGFEQRRIFSGK